MVFFSCGTCCETLKGKAVDQHAGRCRVDTLSCVDCGIEFTRSTYRAHNACMTEAQKYQGSTYKAPKQKKDPQAQWLEMVVSAAAKHVGSRHHATLRLATEFPNVPRKLKPFINFARNSLRVQSERDLTEVFALIAAERPTAPPGAATMHPIKASASDEQETAVDVETAEPTTVEPKLAVAGRKRERSVDASATGPDSGTAVDPTDGAEATSFRAVRRAVDMLAAAGGRMKAKRLRSRLADEMVRLSACSANDALAHVDKRLGKLERKGGIIKDPSGKFVSLVV